MLRTDRSLSIAQAAAVLIAISILSPSLKLHADSHSSSPVGKNADAASLVRAEHWKRARSILEPQSSAHPDDARSCYLLAEVKEAFGDLDGALPLAEHAVELDGGNSDFHLELGKIYGELASRASFFSAGSLATKFRKQLETAIGLNPRNLDALDAMMQFKYQAPGIMGGSKDEARALAGKITALNASEGYLSDAELAELDKDSAQMEGDYLKAVLANPKNYDAQVALAKFYSQPPHAKYDEATKHAQEAIKLDPGRIQGYWILARAFAVTQRWPDLDHVVASAEKNVPDDLRPDYEAAQGLLEVGRDYQRAEGYARKYLSQEPEGGEPDAADGHRLLGLVLEREGRKPEALAEVQTALRLRPNFKAAKEDLKRLED